MCSVHHDILALIVTRLNRATLVLDMQPGVVQ
jgi:hypothetical protein